jgi:hypothetical protein
MPIQWRPGPGDDVFLGAVGEEDIYRVRQCAAGAWRAEVHRFLTAKESRATLTVDHWTVLGTYPSKEAAKAEAEGAERLRSGSAPG